MRKIQKVSLVVIMFLSIVGSLFTNNLTNAGNTNCPNWTVFCGDPMDEVLKDDVKDNLDGVAKTENLIELILGWVSFFLPYAALFAFVGIIYAGFLYVTGFAQEENVEKAKSILMWSVIGLIIIFMAYAIVTTFVKPAG